MKLLYHPFSPPSRAALAVAIHLELPVERVLVNLATGEQQKSEYASINPNMLVPALLDGDFVLWESVAIEQYLCSKKPGQTLFPDDARTRADITRWQCWSLAHLGRYASLVNYERVLKAMRGGGDPDPVKVNEGLTYFNKYAGILNRHLEGRQWIVGNGLTVADFTIGAALMYRGASDLPMEGYPNINAWLERFDALKAWQEAGAM